MPDHRPHRTQRAHRLRILSMNLDTATPTGRLMLNVIGSVAQFEREMMLERQCEGIAKAKGEGKYSGRAPTARAKSDDIVRLANEGATREGIAKELGVSVASVYRALEAARSEAAGQALRARQITSPSRSRISLE
jgi:DNA invertase Pin-like site-specific DNA recombinase